MFSSQSVYFYVCHFCSHFIRNINYAVGVVILSKCCSIYELVYLSGVELASPNPFISILAHGGYQRHNATKQQKYSEQKNSYTVNKLFSQIYT